MWEVTFSTTATLASGRILSAHRSQGLGFLWKLYSKTMVTSCWASAAVGHSVRGYKHNVIYPQQFLSSKYYPHFIDVVIDAETLGLS